MATTRRNGQLSSCEPCRKSKLRCDHSTPICGRCFRRGQPDLCHYHPAPLTQEPGPRQQKRKRRNDDNGRTEPVLDRLPFLSAASTESPEGGLSDAYSPNWNQKKPSTSATGFLGLTSYSAVFSEHDKCIGAEIRSPATNDTVSANPKQIQVGAQILQLLSRNISFYEKMIEARFKLFQGWTLGRPTTLSLLKSIRNVLALHLSNENDDNAALSLSKRFFESTTKPIEHNNSMAFQEYISDITMRWESVGLLFATTGLSTSWIPYDDPAWKYSNQESPRDVAIRAITAGDICLQFCDHSVAMNDPLVWLLLHHTAGLTVAYGDSGMSRHNDNLTAPSECY